LNDLGVVVVRAVSNLLPDTTDVRAASLNPDATVDVSQETLQAPSLSPVLFVEDGDAMLG
jgi:hypothetical protein